MKTNSLKMKDGTTIPAIGFGTFGLSVESQTSDIIISAIQAGYRKIDTAAVYQSEEAIGKAIKRLERGGELHKEQLFITSKLSPEKHGYYQTLHSIEESLNRLQLDYIDLYLIHWPVPRGMETCYREKNLETWQAFEELYRVGTLRAIGVSNFLERHLNHLMDSSTIPPMVNQIELHPQFQQKQLVAFCKEHGIIVEGWSPFFGGNSFSVPKLKELASHYHKSVAQLCIRWCIQKGILPLPRSSSKIRMKENLDVFDFQISNEDLDEIDKLDTDYCHMDIWAYKRQKLY